MVNTFQYGIGYLTYEKALMISKGELTGIITEEAREKVISSFSAVQKIANGDKLVYSINTGFGSLCTTSDG